jgi:transcriptional regulator
MPGAALREYFTGISPELIRCGRLLCRTQLSWQFSVVPMHAHGTIRFLGDRAQSLRHVSELTDRQEALRTEPWKVSDAPADLIKPMLDRIVLFEIAVTRVIGKFKANQQRPENERLAVAAAMATEDIPAAEREELIRLPEKQLGEH